MTVWRQAIGYLVIAVLLVAGVAALPAPSPMVNVVYVTEA